MSATTPFVGVRVFSDLRQTVASIDTRDSTVIGVTLPAPLADNSVFDMDEPVTLSLDNAEQIEKLGAGLAQDTVNQILSEGIVTDVSFVRVPHSDLTDPTAKAEAELNAIVGSAGAKTGAWAQLEAKDHIGLEPGLLISPGYTASRPGDAANPAVVAMDAICNRIIDCMAVVDTPGTTREAAAEYAADFATSLNIIAMYPQAKVWLGGDVIRPLSPHVAAAIVRRDKEVGNPYKAAWNRPLVGIRGLSQRVPYRDGDTSTDANYLVQHGVGTVIENKVLWSPFTTAADPTIKAYRSIKRIRTRRSIEKAMLRPLRQYMSEDLGPHLVTLLAQSLEEACEERQNLKAIIDYQIIWDRKLNPNTFLRDGGLRLKLTFEETPDLTDLQIYTEPQPEAFDVLASSIAEALAALGNPAIRIAS